VTNEEKYQGDLGEGERKDDGKRVYCSSGNQDVVCGVQVKGTKGKGERGDNWGRKS